MSNSQSSTQSTQPVTVEVVIENWDEIEPSDTYDANFWISDAMKAAVGRYFIKHGTADALLTNVSLHIDRERGVVTLTETATEIDGQQAGEQMDSDDENLAEHTDQNRRRAAQVLGLPDPQAGPLVPPTQHGRPEGI